MEFKLRYRMLTFVYFIRLLNVVPAPHIPVWDQIVLNFMGFSGKLPKCMAGTLWGILDPPLNFNSMCPSIRPTMPPVHRIPRPQLGDGDRTEWGTPNWTYESLLTRRMLQQRGIRKRPSFHPAYPVYVGLTVSLLDVVNCDWRNSENINSSLKMRTKLESQN